MAVKVSELQAVVTVDSKPAESGLASFDAKLSSVGSHLGTAFAGAAVGGVAALAGGMVLATTAAAGFESQMSAVKAVSGATASEMAGLQGLALQLGADTSFSAGEAAKGIEELVKAGVSIGDVLGGAASASLSLAAAGAISVGDAAEIAANAMNQFHLKGTELAHVSDLIAGAANASAIDVNDFKFSLAAVGAVANTVGFSFDDTAAAIALLGQAGIKGSDAGTSLKTMLLNLQPATDKQTSLFRELGLITADGANQFFDATGKVKSMAEVAGTLQTALAGQTQQQKLATLETIFGSDAIRAAAVFADQGATGFSEMAAAMSKVTAEAVAAERLNNLKGDIEQLTGSLETAAIKIGMKFTPGLRSIVEGATDTVNTAGPILEGFAESTSDALVESGRQIKDAWGTVKQVFGEGWEPSAEIEPLARAAGEAAIEIKELAGFLQQVNDKAGQMGAWESFGRGMTTLTTEIGNVDDRLGELVAALDRVNGAAGSTESKVSVLAAAVRVVSAAFELWALSMGQLHDTAITFATQAINLVTIFGNLGRAVLALATGDMPSYDAAMQSAATATLGLMTTHGEFAGRTTERFQGAMTAIGLSAETGMAGVAGAVETGMATSEAAVETGSVAMEAAMSTGMTGVVGAVESQGPAAVAAAEAMGTGMASGIETAGPAMASAAETAASGAVSAVEGQSGAASAAGQGVGESIGSGMLAGIRSWVGSIASAAASLVSEAIGAARAEADSHSPSRKTEQLGKDLAEGLEIGLNKTQLGAEMQAKIRAFIASSREYIPVAGEIARVEEEIKRVRDQGQTDSLFRMERMVTVDAEALRLKRDQVSAERDLIPLRQELASVAQQATDIERGSLGDRTRIMELEAQRKQIKLQQLQLEQAILTTYKGSDRVESIQKQIDRLRDQDRLLGIEQDRISTTNSLYATSARIRSEGLSDNLRGQETVIAAIKNQLDVLAAEQGLFGANEAIIKNATDNEVRYRERLIAVFREEGRPLAERITAGLGLIGQLEKEGRISKELADRLRDVAKGADLGTGATSAIGKAAEIATPQLDAASRKAAEMAANARAIGQGAGEAASQVSVLAQSLGRLPSWFTPTGAGGGAPSGSVLFPPRRDTAGMIPASGVTAGLFSDGGSAGPVQTHRFVIAGPDGRTLAEWHVQGREMAVDLGLMPRGSG